MTSGLDLLVTDPAPMPEDELLRDTVAAILDKSPTPPPGELDAAWADTAAAQLPWIGVPESAGGAGGTQHDLEVVLGAVAARGRSLPLTETALAGGWLLDRAGWQVGTGVELPVLDVRAAGAAARPDGSAWRVSGYFPAVPWGRWATGFLVVLPTPAGEWVVGRVPATHAAVTEGVNVAGDPVDTVELAGVRLPSDSVSGLGRDGFQDALSRAALGRAIQAAAAMAAALRLTVRYAGERRQFGRPIASFQAVSHRLAAMAGQTALARSAVHLAVRCPSASTAAVAKSAASSASLCVAADAHQIHGAMGVSEEYPLGRLTTRLWSWAGEYGDERYWNRVLGRMTLAGDRSLWETVVDLRRTSVE